jgi:hypothetical protein
MVGKAKHIEAAFDSAFHEFPVCAPCVSAALGMGMIISKHKQLSFQSMIIPLSVKKFKGNLADTGHIRLTYIQRYIIIVLYIVFVGAAFRRP